MKKILEVLQYGDGDIRFNTDINVTKDPDKILSISANATLAMVTKLWGGNEQSVIAVIRALAIADIAASVNPEEMLNGIRESAQLIKHGLLEAKKEFEKNGGQVITFGPGIKPGHNRS